MIQQVINLYQNLHNLILSEKFTIEENNPDFYPVEDLDSSPAATQLIYENLTQSKIKWNKGEIDGYYVDGSIHILPLDRVNGDWKNIISFDYQEPSDPLQFFKPVDYFSPENMVGIVDKDEDPLMYYLSLGKEPQSLSVNALGYLELLSMTRGFFAWQLVLLEHKTGVKYPEVVAFKKYMPQLFDDFEYTTFIATYDRLRIG